MPLHIMYYCITPSMSHLHPLQAEHYDRNFQLPVDEDDLKWGANEKKILSKQLLENFPQTRFMKLSHYSEMTNDALIHSEGLKGN